MLRTEYFPLNLLAISFILFTYIVEKTPWIVTNIVLPLGKVIILAVIIIWLPFYPKEGIEANYQQQDRSVETLFFAQASAEIKEVKGASVVIELTFPWQWYLRNYNIEGYWASCGMIFLR